VKQPVFGMGVFDMVACQASSASFDGVCVAACDEVDADGGPEGVWAKAVSEQGSPDNTSSTTLACRVLKRDKC
jgi:hypothetical protein